MNKVFLSGNLTRDPEVRYTQSGKAFARVGIAINRPFSKDKAVEVVVENVEFAGGKRDASDAPKRKPKDDFDGENVNLADTP